MKERPKSSAFLLIALAFLCIYLVKSVSLLSHLRLGVRPSTEEVSPAQLDSGARLVYGLPKVDINSATASGVGASSRDRPGPCPKDNRRA